MEFPPHETHRASFSFARGWVRRWWPLARLEQVLVGRADEDLLLDAHRHEIEQLAHTAYDDGIGGGASRYMIQKQSRVIGVTVSDMQRASGDYEMEQAARTLSRSVS